MKRSLLFVMMLSGCLVAHAGAPNTAPRLQEMALASSPQAVAPSASQSSADGLGASAVWQPPKDFLTNAHNVCDKGAGPASFGECFINQMSAAGAPADAVTFTRMLYKQSDGQVGMVWAIKKFATVDAAQVFYPLRANDNYGVLLMSGDGKMLDVDDLKLLDQAAMQADPMFQAIRKQYPKADLFPGDRSGIDPWPRLLPLPDGGQQFVVTYPLIDGCHACRHLGAARFGWNFDASGKFLRTVYIPTPPPPKLLRRPHGPQQPPPPMQQPQAQQNPQ